VGNPSPGSRSPRLPRRSRRVTLLAALAALAAAPGDAAAHPLTIRAQTRVAVDLERRPEGAVLRVSLRDDLGLPVPHEPIGIDLDGFAPVGRITDDSGDAEIALSLADLHAIEGLRGGEVGWRVTYAGDRIYGAASARGALDLRRRPATVRVRAEPQVVGTDDRGVRIHVDLTGAGEPIADAEIRVRLGDATELSGRTGATGRATFLVRGSLLGASGRYAVRARFPGDHLHRPADDETSLRVLLPTRLTLRVGREGEPRLGRYRFSGRLSDAHGPIADATIGVFARATGAESVGVAPVVRELRALATTRGDGIYLAAIPAEELFAGRSQGELEVQAVYSPDDRHQAASSRTVRIAVPPPPGVPAGWYLLGLGLIVSLLLGAHAIRQRLVQEVLFKIKARRIAAVALAGRPPVPHDDPPFVAPPSPQASAASRADHVAGIVLDATSRAPIPGALVRLTPTRAPAEGGAAGDAAAEPITARTDGRGRFDCGPLASGPHALAIEATGYLPRERAVTIPHDGGYDGATYNLVAIRRRVRDVYAGAVQRFGAGLAWGVDTPREAFHRTRRGADADEQALLELRRLVESAWFSSRAPTPDDAARAAALAERLET